MTLTVDRFAWSGSAVPTCVPEVRERVARWATFLSGQQLDDLILATSELVSNAVRHGPPRSMITVAACVAGDVIRLEVHDDGGRASVSPREPDTRGGRGLHIVAAVAEEWGTCEPATTVWCSMRISS